MSPVITVENLGKRYRLGARSNARSRYRSLAEELTTGAKQLIRNPGSAFRSAPAEEFWALKDVSFEVQQGEVLGIIGRNGAGKSTLLKILSRITEPTTGKVRIKGRVASLLEVGTGFHPELTGRENIFLNGAILGMTRAEIKAKFDEIVAFAEVEQFLETPVKRYSSGMYVRLAFAVAAHLEPEILVVDEVLAVGDAEFQKKCLGKMSDVAKGGRTVLFVSHNMATVESLCSRGILLLRGQITAVGPPSQVIVTYVSTRAPADDDGVREGIIKRVVAVDEHGRRLTEVRAGAPVTIQIDVDTQDQYLATPEIGLGFDSILGQRLFTVGTYLSSDGVRPFRGRCSFFCHIDSLPLAEGEYSVKAALSVGLHQPIAAVEAASSIVVVSADFFGNGRMPTGSQGPFLVRSRWAVAA